MNVNIVEILLVEDNPDDVKLTLHALRKYHLANNIQVAADGEEALEFLFCRGKYSDRSMLQVPKVILLDLKLPKVDGIEVLKEIKSDATLRKIPVVVLTSSKEDRDIIDAYELGVNSYIVKPVEFDEFVKAISNVGLYWLILNEAPAKA